MIGLLIAACTEGAAHKLQGYAEADYLYLSPRTGGVVTMLAVDEGEDVASGRLLVTFDDVRETAAVERARESLAEAKAAALLAEQTFARTKALRAARQSPQAELDRARSALDAANARVRETEAALIMAVEDLADRSIRAPAAGRVEEVFRRVGERAGPGEPVLALLPPANIKIRFFLPEPLLSQVKQGDEVNVSCDACEPFRARISFIAKAAQYTPPFIFSREERAKLVYLIEARPERSAALRPGQPLDVELLE